MQTPKQLLAAHRSESYPDVFYIQRLANFRAQMKRAVMLVRAATHHQIFQKRSTLLIIGGGVSGLAAGLEAAKHGMLVTLLESEETLLSVQGKCATRYLHPHEYDWPRAHWMEASFPFLARDKLFCPKQMHWKAGAASTVAKNMAKRIISSAPPNLDVNLGVRRIPVSLQTLRADFDPDREFEFILICAGAMERTRLKKFTSFQYWENDPLENLLPLIQKRRIRKVLISGGGDGGLQDLLRIMHYSRKGESFSAGRLLKQILPALRRIPEFVKWISSKQNDCRAFREDPKTMWREFIRLLDLMEKDSEHWRFVSRKIAKLVNPVVLSDEITIHLVFKKKMFSDAFALNAFLVHLIVRAIKRETNPKLRPNCELEDVESTSNRHRCSGSAEKCCGKPHKVTFKVGRAVVLEPEVFDLIVLRHGSDQAVRVRPRQILRRRTSSK